MNTQVTLLIICMSFSGALSLQCFPYVYNETLDKYILTQCPSTCASTTTSVAIYLVGGVSSLPYTDWGSVFYCGSPSTCVNSSINVGLVKIANNTRCCSTNICNNYTLPVMPTQSINGRSCYTCDLSNDCSGKLYCEGAEDSCITATVAQGSNIMTMKGCTTSNMCNTTLLRAQGFILTDVECCRGNMCNSAERFTLSFHLMFIPLLSFTLFY